uniref:Transmembrane protein n=1 Tax=Panagrellus redivivus TaxID=6233 RepID=A0A7E4VT05_PANRE
MQLLQKGVELRGSQALNVASYQRVIWHRRFMAFATTLTIAAVALYVIALLLPNWAVIDFVNTSLEHVNVQLGVWGEWRTVNTTGVSEWIPHLPKPSEKLLRLADADLKHFYYAQIALATIALALMAANNFAAILTFTYHRFVYKRVVAFIHFLIAGCVAATIEVLTNSVTEWNTEVAQKSLQSQSWDYSAAQTTGLAVFLAWLVVFIYIFAAVIFIVASSKQKGSRAATAEFEIEDRPIYIGR